MALSYPRRQTLFIAIICIAIIIVVGWYAFGSEIGNNFQNGSVNLLANAPTGSNTSTIDNINWQKDFYTISSSTNSAFNTSGAKDSASSTEILTNTDMVGREFFTAYAQLQQAGKVDDATAIASAADKIVNKAVSRMTTATVYKSANLNITKNTDTTSMGNYALTLADIIGTKMPKQSEADIVSIAASTGDMGLLKTLDPIITAYQASIRALLAMPVPQSVAAYHLMLVNGISQLLFNSQAFQDLEADPVASLMALGQEIPALEQLTGALDQIKVQLSYSGITLVY
jgi:hypothetical protein